MPRWTRMRSGRARRCGDTGKGGAALPQPPGESLILRLGAGLAHLLVDDVLAGDACSGVRERQPQQGAGASLRRAQKWPDNGQPGLENVTVVLAPSCAYDPRVEAVGTQFRGAPGQFAREQDVAELGGSVDTHPREGPGRLQVIEIEQAALVSIGRREIG